MHSIDDYFMGDSSGGKRTHKMDLHALYRNLEMEEWYHPSVYQMVYKRMRQYFKYELMEEYYEK